MAHIKLSELSPIGSELFQDSESFINELSSEEIGNILGGSGVVRTVITQGVGSIVSHASKSGGHISKTVGHGYDLSKGDIDDISISKIDDKFLKLLFIKLKGNK